MSSTTVAPLAENEWTSLGACPAMVGVSGGVALLVVADSVPAANALGFTLRPTDLPLSIQAAGQLWAKATSALITSAIVLPVAASA